MSCCSTKFRCFFGSCSRSIILSLIEAFFFLCLLRLLLIVNHISATLPLQDNASCVLGFAFRCVVANFNGESRTLLFVFSPSIDDSTMKSAVQKLN